MIALLPQTRKYPVFKYHLYQSFSPIGLVVFELLEHIQTDIQTSYFFIVRIDVIFVFNLISSKTGCLLVVRNYVEGFLGLQSIVAVAFQLMQLATIYMYIQPSPYLTVSDSKLF